MSAQSRLNEDATGSVVHKAAKASMFSLAKTLALEIAGAGLNVDSGQSRWNR